MNVTERIVRRLPGPLNAVLKGVRHAVDPLVVRAWRRQTGDHAALPPSRLRARTGSGSSPTVWRVSAAQHAIDLEKAVSDSTGRELDTFSSVLDWGCGSGRVLCALDPLAAPTCRLTGSDVDAAAIAWANRHVPHIRWKTNRSTPPLPFDDAAFDLVYSVSILTHLDEALQLAWVNEIARVLEPGGIALLSVHGEHAFAECTSGRVVSKSGTCARRIARHRSLADGFLFEPYDVTRWNRRGFPGIDEPFGMAFHSPSYIREQWSRPFEVLAVLPRAVGGWQDLAVLERR